MTSTHELLEDFCRQHSYDRKAINAWTEKVDAQLREFNTRLEALVAQIEPDYEKLKDNCRNLCEWPVPSAPMTMEENVMTENHPTEPSYELIKQWLGDEELTFSAVEVARQAARWGSDQELDACCEWLRAQAFDVLAIKLYISRRPKPKKQKAMEALKRIDTLVRVGSLLNMDDFQNYFESIYEALEDLPDD